MREEKDIWFVDDDEIFRFIVKGLMKEGGFSDRITYFDDGDRAILKMIEISKNGGKGPKIVFLDLSMKHLEGWQLIDLLNEFESCSNIVLVTSSINPKDRLRAEKEPLVKGYLTKPVQREDLEKYIEKFAP